MKLKSELPSSWFKYIFNFIRLFFYKEKKNVNINSSKSLISIFVFINIFSDKRG